MSTIARPATYELILAIALGVSSEHITAEQPGAAKPVRQSETESQRQSKEVSRKPKGSATQVRTESPDDRFIRKLDGARFGCSDEISGIRQSATYEIRGHKVLLKWQEIRPNGREGSSIRREEFLIVGRNFFRDDQSSCAVIFSGAQHCRCKYTIGKDSIHATMLLDGKELPTSGASFGICLGPSEIPRQR